MTAQRNFIHRFLTVGAMAIVMMVAAGASKPAQAASSFGFGLGISYNSGSNYGYGAQPYSGYGAAGGSFGGIAQVCGGGGYGVPAPILAPTCGGTCQIIQQPTPCNGGCGGGGGGGGFAMPSMPALPALPPVAPPGPYVSPTVAVGNLNWGPQWGSNQGLALPGINSGANCVPCSIGMQPQVISPVAGGPYVGGYDYGRGGLGLSGAGGISIGGLGGAFGTSITIVGERDNGPDYLAEMRGAVAATATNVYVPYMPQTQLYMPEGNYNTGNRDSYLDPRAQVAH